MPIIDNPHLQHDDLKNQDGRIKRSERSRQAIVDAMIALMQKGIYIPTAKQVADTAGISIRTVFRHFSEMDLLYKEIDEVVRPSYEKYFVSLDDLGSLQQRIESLVDARVRGYVEIFNLEKATHALLWQSPHLRTCYLRNQQQLRKLLLKALPELEASDKEFAVEVADATTSFEYFERLHVYQNLVIDDCKTIIARRLAELLD